ncbi:MAG: hypothetical protein UY18_C0024G0008 [Microgenomates group bacterium GW2011_GWF2_47_9]|nr:MAG: hypothetical protein UY18_C0024G0008 [Microgenomates group bacterium GW2011_GWF2_47_9]
MESGLKRGQVGLILLVVMGIVISIVLSIASRSLTDLVLSRQEKENSTTFALAEAGVEKALQAISEGGVMSGPLSDSTSFVTGEFNVNALSSFELYVNEGQQAELDLTGYVANTISVYWTRTGDPSENLSSCVEGSETAPAALEVVMVNTAGVVTRAYYNPYDGGSCNLSTNGFTASLTGGATYRSRANITLPNPGSMAKLRLKPLYNGATISASGTNLDTQLYLVQSEAEGGSAKKEIEVRRTLDSGGSIFDYSLFSGGASGTIVK